ncbi:MAG: DUF3078 domain-containing protein [Parabacteroides sp.]|nr:DUF3078 domain-containing protein [Parabacteroides sp.]
MIKRSVLALFIVLLFSSNRAGAQDVNIIGGSQLNKQVQVAAPDTFPLLEIEETELEKIPDLRTQFEKLNSSYSAPAAPSENLLRFLKKDEIDLSPEARYWVDWVRDPSTIINPWMTLRDTTIVNPLFTPILFKGGLIPEDLQLYDKNFVSKQRPSYSLFTPDTTLFQDEVLRNKLQNTAYNYVRVNYPEYFRYSERDLPTDIVKTHIINKPTYEPALIKIENDPNAFSDVDAPVKFIPERRYWTSHFESAIQFAQNYISPNWHKGGVSTLNLTNRQYFVYNYNKDKIQFTNELEWKTNVYTAPKDTLRDYKIGDDVLRLHSNIGYRAFSKWFYTFDATFQTQMFSNFAENTDNKLAGFLSPFSINLGLGMKYDLNKSFANNRYKKLTLSTNLAPLSYTFMYSTNKNIDLGRHGFKKIEGTEDEYEHKLSQFGSTINATMTFQFNRNISWYSRFYYFTSYDRMLGEFENRLTMAISRFFSTTISLNLRYDDAVAKKDDFDSYLQVNELLSFGFNYKW